MRGQGRTVEQELARLAGSQHGVVTREQLLRVGIRPHQIDRRLRSGVLLREHRGVYRVGHRAPSLEARYLAAVRACGGGALLSGRAAGHLLGLIEGPPPAPEVTTPTERRVAGVTTRRARRADRIDASVCRAVPVMTPARVLVD